jgi:hypothetical protein
MRWRSAVEMVKLTRSDHLSHAISIGLGLLSNGRLGLLSEADRTVDTLSNVDRAADLLLCEEPRTQV